MGSQIPKKKILKQPYSHQDMAFSMFQYTYVEKVLCRKGTT